MPTSLVCIALHCTQPSLLLPVDRANLAVGMSDTDVPAPLRAAVTPLLSDELKRLSGEEADANLLDCQ